VKNSGRREQVHSPDAQVSDESALRIEPALTRDSGLGPLDADQSNQLKFLERSALCLSLSGLVFVLIQKKQIK
jgi:hypothetical protein